MNKFMLFPLVVVLIMAIIASLGAETSTYSETIDLDPYAGGSITDNEGEKNIDVEGIVDTDIDIDGMSAGIALLIAALAVGVIAGIKVLGSGLSDLSQRMIFLTVIYYGIWTIFSVFAWDVIEDMLALGIMLWLVMTISYTIGFAQEVTSGGTVE